MRALEEVYGRRMCERCGRGAPEPVSFERTQLRPVCMIDPAWSATWTAGELSDGTPVMVPPRGRVPTITYWVGPLVDRPQPPTPEELLIAAGLNTQAEALRM